MNKVLEREVSGYRFIDEMLVQISSESEVNEIIEAIKITKQHKLTPVGTHLDTAMKMLSDRKQPDYRNSIKESISSVEAICKIISGDNKSTLSNVLKMMEDKMGLHPALKAAFSRMYGYTSDADGIRHALIDAPSCDFEDAKYMLVACSAFVNYLISKASKASIEL